jgi:REP element-mobilizing transposase RayT
MPRRPRAFFPGIYHLAPHASDDRHLFLNDSERTLFLDGLGRIFDRLDIGVVGYTLMGTHYHAVARIPDARVSRALQQLHTWYSRLHNKLNGRRSHLFRAHPFAREIDSDADLLTTCRYLAWNPVEAGLARRPLDWPWSSVGATAGLGTSPVPLDVEPVEHALGGGPTWRQRYRDHVARRP